jgi:hypothetical protein
MSAGDVSRCRPMADGGANWWPFEDKPVEIVPSPTFGIFRKNRGKVKVDHHLHFFRRLGSAPFSAV